MMLLLFYFLAWISYNFLCWLRLELAATTENYHGSLNVIDLFLTHPVVWVKVVQGLQGGSWGLVHGQLPRPGCSAIPRGLLHPRGLRGLTHTCDPAGKKEKGRWRTGLIPSTQIPPGQNMATLLCNKSIENIILILGC